MKRKKMMGGVAREALRIESALRPDASLSAEQHSF
jgi:hypothetical protein